MCILYVCIVCVHVVCVRVCGCWWYIYIYIYIVWMWDVFVPYCVYIWDVCIGCVCVWYVGCSTRERGGLGGHVPPSVCVLEGSVWERRETDETRQRRMSRVRLDR
jgi:hypothetical protein